MLGGGFNQKSYYNFWIETLLPERLKVFRDRKYQAVRSGKELRFTDAEFSHASVRIGLSFSKPRPSFPSVENFESDSNGARRSTARSIQDMR